MGHTGPTVRGGPKNTCQGGPQNCNAKKRRETVGEMPWHFSSNPPTGLEGYHRVKKTPGGAGKYGNIVSGSKTLTLCPASVCFAREISQITFHFQSYVHILF